MNGYRPAWISLGALGRWLVGLLLAGSGFLIAQQAGLGTETFERLTKAQGGEASQIARRVIAYRLDPVRPTLFRFSQPVTSTRIITQPTLSPGSASPGEGWTYSIKVELLDERGSVIETQDIYSRSVLFASSGKRRGPTRYYRGTDELVAPADEVRVASSRPFAAIRVLAGTADSDVVAIDVRVGERRPLNASAAESAFARFSQEDRARLAAANAFPPELLTREERTEIAINQWRPIGPVGIDGRDYRMMVLYEEAEENSVNQVDEGPASNGEAGG
jgi:hypothetical protein